MVDIHEAFAHSTPSEEQEAHMTAIREGYSTLREIILANTTPCRGQSIALTELETSAMWAVKAAKQGIRTNIR